MARVVGKQTCLTNGHISSDFTLNAHDSSCCNFGTAGAQRGACHMHINAAPSQPQLRLRIWASWSPAYEQFIIK